MNDFNNIWIQNLHSSKIYRNLNYLLTDIFLILNQIQCFTCEVIEELLILKFFTMLLLITWIEFQQYFKLIYIDIWKYFKLYVIQNPNIVMSEKSKRHFVCTFNFIAVKINFLDLQQLNKMLFCEIFKVKHPVINFLLEDKKSLALETIDEEGLISEHLILRNLSFDHLNILFLNF